jgi:small-conductance mechanosensitive channel
MGRVTRLKPEEPKGPSVPRWLRPKVYSPLSPKEIYEMNLAVQQRKINDLVSEIRQIATQREKLTSRIKEIKHSINWVQISIDERMNRYYVYADPGRSAYWLQIAEEGRRELERKNRVLKRLMEDVAKLSKKIDDLKKQILVERGVKREPLAICAP